MQEQLDLEDKKKLQRFVNRANRLSLCKFFRHGEPRMVLALGNESTKAIVPEREEFIEMLTILRPFIMKDDDIFFNETVKKVRTRAGQDESSLDRLNSVCDKFNFYRDDKKTNKYRKKYSDYVSPFSALTRDFGERTIFDILDLVMNGYYFHSDLGKQRKLIDFVKEQTNRWQGSLSEDDLAKKALIINRERVREAFKYEFYELVIKMANCVLELKDLTKELFDLPLDEELYQESQVLYEFLDI